jgi:putative nucleotidyltransferase with HDIG domain
MESHPKETQTFESRREKQIKRSYIFTRQLHEFIEALTSAIDARDPNTAYHSWAVAEISELIAREMDFSEEFTFLVHIAGHLHDIGKIGIPDSILLKPGRLTEDEIRVIRMHPEIGADIVSRVKELSHIAEMVLSHHERRDGSGYPHGIGGDDIPSGARIIAVADSLDAMINDRSYRPPREFDAALREIEGGAGTMYDPDVVDALLRIDVKKIMDLYR